jgi:hypothetical protein
MDWLSHNLGVVISLASIFVVLVGAFYANRAKIESQGEKIKALEDHIKDLETKVDKHQANSLIHIDPDRDKRAWDDFRREIFERFDGVGQRFDTTDRKLERLMIVTPPPGS